MHIRFTAGLLMIFAAASACQLTVLDGRPVVPDVWLNGKGPFRFLLDTGAQTNQIHTDLARKLGLTPTFRVELATATGTTLAGGGRLAEIRVGEVQAKDQEFLITPLTGVRTLSRSIDGVLGQEFLLHFDYLLDLRSRKLIFGAQTFAEPQTPFSLVDGRMGVDTSHGRLILDSGTSTLVLFRSTMRGAASFVQTASGTGEAEGIRRLRLKIGETSYSLPAAIVPHHDAQSDGLLPASAFRSIYVSNSRQHVVLR